MESKSISEFHIEIKKCSYVEMIFNNINKKNEDKSQKFYLEALMREFKNHTLGIITKEHFEKFAYLESYYFRMKRELEDIIPNDFIGMFSSLPTENDRDQYFWEIFESDITFFKKVLFVSIGELLDHYNRTLKLSGVDPNFKFDDLFKCLSIHKIEEKPSNELIIKRNGKLIWDDTGIIFIHCLMKYIQENKIVVSNASEFLKSFLKDANIYQKNENSFESQGSKFQPQGKLPKDFDLDKYNTFKSYFIDILPKR